MKLLLSLFSHRARAALLALAALTSITLLPGCAGTYLLDNQVQTFAQPASLGVPLSFRFERLPSQQAQPAQAQVEALAEGPLTRAGFTKYEPAPRLGIQVAARAFPVLSPWATSRGPWGWGPAWGPGWGMGARYPEPAWYRREVSIIVRELSTQAIVYETHAVNEGPWADQPSAFAAMFDAALQGFPNPPPGVRQVNVNLPR